MQTIPQILAKELGKPQQAVENVIALLEQGNTIPFIARYRKEQHGSMDDTALPKRERTNFEKCPEKLFCFRHSLLLSCALLYHFLF